MKLPIEVKLADRRLPELGRAFDRPIDGLQPEQILALGFGNRGWDLYRGLRHSLTGPSMYARHVDLRALLEVAILTRWIEIDPVLRVKLWHADDRRTQLRGQRLGTEFAGLRGTQPPREFSAEEIAEMKEEIAQARADARKAGIPGVPREGRVLPSIEAMTIAHDDLRETTILYWSLSPSAHAGGRSFAGDDLKIRDGKTYLAPIPMLKTPASLLAIGIASLCMLWASVSRQIGMGLEDDCDRVRLSVVFPDRHKL